MKHIRYMSQAGCLLLFSGLMHTAIWLMEFTPWTGPVSWRKPILFGFSSGVTLISLAWVLSKLTVRQRDFWMIPLITLSLVVEVGLITLQQWRGVPSHFNTSTSLDTAISSAMEFLIAVVTVGIMDVTWRAFQHLPVTRPMTLAIRMGMVLLTFSCVLGFLISFVGKSQLETGARPDIYGQAGVLKFPHGIPMHAIQILPLGVWLLSQLGFSLSTQMRIVLRVSLVLVLLTVYSIMQTLAGNARFEWNWISGVMLIPIAVLVCHSLWIVIAACLNHVRPRRVHNSS